MGRVEIKSKFDAEFRRFTLDSASCLHFEDFRSLLKSLHQLSQAEGPAQGGSDLHFHVFYIDPKDDDLLPITNTENYRRALLNSRPLLRLVIQRQGECQESYYRRTVHEGADRTSLLTSMLGGGPKSHKVVIPISAPTEFRQVSSIIDVDVVPETCRRVRLIKHGSDKPLGFYIRDGTSVRVTPYGLEKVPGIFISRLLAGGLAESTGLLAVNDEVLEVNGIEVIGKTLDQVTDMMVANAANLVVTVKPANQGMTGPLRGTFARNSNASHGSTSSTGRDTRGIEYSHAGVANANYSDSDEHDEIWDMTSGNFKSVKENKALLENGSVRSRKQVLQL